MWTHVSCRKNKPVSASCQAVSVCVMYCCNRKNQTPKYCNNFIFNFFSTSLIVAMKMTWSALMTQMMREMMRDCIFETPPKSSARKGWGANQGGRGASMSWSTGQGRGRGSGVSHGESDSKDIIDDILEQRKGKRK